MLATRHLQDEVFELLDWLTQFVNDHALEFLLAIMALTVAGGLWLLLVLRKHRKAQGTQLGGGLNVGYGFFIGPKPPPPPPQMPPPADPQVPPWGDSRD